ncbi:MAG: hypothetical protein ACKVKO_07240 [Acidimicrobiales bacterium]|jgi:hypothetical protein
MGSLIFLAIALGVSAVGVGILWLFSLDRRKFDASINEFQRDMNALNGKNNPRRPRR